MKFVLFILLGFLGLGLAQKHVPYQRSLPNDFRIDTAYYSDCHGYCMQPFEKRAYLDLDEDNIADSVFYKLRKSNPGPNYWEHLQWIQIGIRLSKSKLYAIIPQWIFYDTYDPHTFFNNNSFGDAFTYVTHPCKKKRMVELFAGIPLGMPFDSILNVEVDEYDNKYLMPSHSWMDSLVIEQKATQWIQENIEESPSEKYFWKTQEIHWSRWFVIEFLENEMSISTTKYENSHCELHNDWYNTMDSNGERR